MSTLKVNTITPISGDTVNVDGDLTVGGSPVSGFPFTGSAAISGSFLVTGSSTLAVRVSGSTALTGSILVSGSTVLSGSIFQSGSNNITGSQKVSGSLLVTGSSALALRVSGSTALTGSLFVSGTVSGSFIGDGSSLTGISGYTVANSANNRVITSVDATNANAEANLTFDGTKLGVTGNVSASAGFSGSFQGDGSGLTDLAGGGPFAQTGSFYATSNNIQITGSLNATSVTETSALRYKKYVKPLRSQSDNVYKLRPVHFKWKDDNRGDIGLIAEEVGEIYPELVSIGVDGNAEGISYTKLTAVLIKTIQELSARIDKLENKN